MVKREEVEAAEKRGEPYRCPFLCDLGTQCDDLRRMCDELHGFVNRVVFEGQRKDALLACCGAGGKELVVPCVVGDEVIFAAIFNFRSPRQDKTHLRNLAVFHGLPQKRIERLWSGLPKFSPSQAEWVVRCLGQPTFLSKYELPPSAQFQTAHVTDLANAYARPFDDGPQFYDRDIRVFRMLGGLRAMPGIQSVEVAHFATHTTASILRLFARDLEPVVPYDPPIFSFCVPESVGNEIQKYIHRHKRPRPETDGGETLFGIIMGSSPTIGERSGFRYTFELPTGPSSNSASSDGRCVGAADVVLVKDYPRRAELARACLAAASDWTDTTAIDELLKRLRSINPANWEDFKTLLGQFSYNLESPDIAAAKDKWVKFMRALYDTLWSQPVGPPPLDEAPIVKRTEEALEWLRDKSRRKLRASALEKRLEKVRHIIFPSL